MGDFKSDNKFTKFISGKGFYVALAVCLIGTAAAAWVALSSTQEEIEKENSSLIYSGQSRVSSSSSSVSQVFPQTEDVNKSVSDIPMSSSSQSSSQSVSSSSAASTESADQSSQQTLFQKPQPQAFVLPVNGEVFAPYSNGELVKNVTLGEWRTHDGIDIKAEKGMPVACVADGTVSKVYDDPMWGTVVEVEHGGNLTSIYCGLAKETKVNVGDKVKIEQELGTVDEIPAEISLDSHLHFGMKKDGKWTDPIAAMGKAQ